MRPGLPDRPRRSPTVSASASNRRWWATTSAALAPGMTVALRAEIDGWVRRDTVLVTDDGAELLSA